MSVSLDALVASPHWEWAECVRLTDGQMVVEVFSDRLVTFHRVDGGRVIGWEDPDRVRPDIEHAGNHGHLLGLVRKAWAGCRVDFAVFESGAARVEILDLTPLRVAQGRGVDIAFPGDTLGRALAAALLAAPMKTGES
jgi:hypothetical protein